jgi:hypothetical protein
MWNTDPKQMQQYYETLITVWGVAYERGRVKEGR